MTDVFATYDLMLANPPEYAGPCCPSCGRAQEDERWCNRCEDLAAAQEDYRDVAALVRAARALLESTHTWASPLGRIVERFPEVEAK